MRIRSILMMVPAIVLCAESAASGNLVSDAIKAVTPPNPIKIIQDTKKDIDKGKIPLTPPGVGPPVTVKPDLRKPTDPPQVQIDGKTVDPKVIEPPFLTKARQQATTLAIKGATWPYDLAKSGYNSLKKKAGDLFTDIIDTGRKWLGDLLFYGLVAGFGLFFIVFFATLSAIGLSRLFSRRPKSHAQSGTVPTFVKTRGSSR